jgi:hypothetical protein
MLATPAVQPRPVYALRADVFASPTRTRGLPPVGGPNGEKELAWRILAYIGSEPEAR